MTAQETQMVNCAIHKIINALVSLHHIKRFGFGEVNKALADNTWNNRILSFLHKYLEGYKQKWPKLHRGTNGKNLYVSIGSRHIGVFSICTPIVGSILFVAFHLLYYRMFAVYRLQYHLYKCTLRNSYALSTMHQ